MAEEHTADLYELADLVHAVARRLPAPTALEPGPCTATEITVMRCVGRVPGISARAAADACGLPSSNFSRVLKRLVSKGLLERRSDPDDARIVHLHPTDRAIKNSLRMREAWGGALAGAALDRDEIATVTQALRRIEAHLSDAPTTDVAEQASRPSQDDPRKRRTTVDG